MKKVFLLILCSFLMVSCSFDFLSSSEHNSSFSSEISSNDSLSSRESSIYYGDRFVDMYALNDFHGATEPSGYESGILKVGTFFKQKGQEDNTLILNSGDMWQGSIHSNSNYGQLLTDVMNDIEFDCFTLGNHEFDWGVDYIKSNRMRSDKNDGYQTPFLAANVYNYNIDTKKVLDYASLGDKYVIRELENGLKVGIIGVIGKDQITSITSQYVDNLTFLDPVPIIKELSDELKIDKGCDVVVVDAHTDQYSITESSENYFCDNAGLTSISDVSNKRYVDAVFCAHSHQNFNSSLNGVPFIQASCNGKGYSYVSLKVDTNYNVSCIDSRYVYTSNISNIDIDISINEIYQSYKVESDKLGSEVLGNLTGTLEKKSSLPNLICTALGNYAQMSNYKIDYAITNVGRNNIEGSLTYESLFKAAPFDNVVYIANVSGSNLLKSLQSNYFYRLDEDKIDLQLEYTIAIIDYLLLHRDSNRDYNYFTDFDIIGKLSSSDNDFYNYRSITADYIRNEKNIIASNYSSSNNRHNKNMLTSNVSFN